MSLWLDQYYLKQLSTKLPMFKNKGNGLYNARCVICGDSQTHKTKARWYAFPHKNAIMTKCHNCGYAQSFKRFLEFVDPTLYNQYLVEALGENTQPQQPNPKLPVKSKVDLSVFNALRTVSQLPPTHPAKKWIVARRIPSNLHYKLFYAPYFGRFASTILPDKNYITDRPDPRIILPLIDTNNQTVFGFQGRTIDPDNKLRYYTVMIDNCYPKFFGLEKIDAKRKIIVVEGPFDSMLLNNAIASCGSDLYSQLHQLKINQQEFVLVYDNEKRNRQIVKKMSDAIDHGYSIVIWPDTIQENDINDMFVSGMSLKDINQIITDNTYTGLEAKARLTQWRKVCT
jgi:hypothetical protein